MLDYGGQYSQLIARRVRECGVFSELLPHHVGVEEVRRRRPKGLILSGGPASVYADGAPGLDPELLELGIPVLGICYGMQALVLTLGGKVEGAEVGEFGRSQLTVRRAGPAARRHARGAELLDVAPRHGLRAAAGLHRAGELDGVAGGRARGRRARDLRHPVPPRGRPHALRPAGADDVPRRHLRLRADVEPGLDHRGADRADPRPGRQRPGHLRPLRRRRLVGGGAARAPRGRRPAHVRVRRPRPDAQERGRAGHLRLPRPLQGAARGRRRRGPLPRAARRAVASRRPSARRSAPSSSASSRRRR